MSSDNLTVVNVYEIAADVGKDVEAIIDQYGSDAVKHLMPRIINALELLEGFVKGKEEQDGRINSLQDQLVQTKKDMDARTKENLKLTAKIQKDENSKEEQQMSWLQELTRLRSENEHLKQQVNETEGLVVQEKEHEQEALMVLVKMKETVDKQRDQLRANDHELRSKAADIDALQQQVERLVKLNQDLHRKNEVIQLHAKDLIKEKSQLLTEIKVIDKDKADLVQARDEMDSSAPKHSQTKVPPNLEGMIIIDPKDPNRPRFTRDELQRVLFERDELKLKLVELTEKLGDDEEKLRIEKTSQSPRTPRKISDVKTPVSSKPPTKPETSMKKFFSNLFRFPIFDNKSDKIDSETWEVLNPKVMDDGGVWCDDPTTVHTISDSGLQEEILLQPFTSPIVENLTPFDESHFGSSGDFKVSVKRLQSSKNKRNLDENLNNYEKNASEKDGASSDGDLSGYEEEYGDEDIDGDDSDEDVKEDADYKKKGSEHKDNPSSSGTASEEGSKAKRKIFPSNDESHSESLPDAESQLDLEKSDVVQL